MFDALTSRAVQTAPDVPALIEAAWKDMRCPVSADSLSHAVASLLETEDVRWLDELGWDSRQPDLINGEVALERMSGRNAFVLMQGRKPQTDERPFVFGNPEGSVYGVLVIAGGWYDAARLDDPNYTVYLGRPDTSRMEAAWVWERLPASLVISVHELDRRPAPEPGPEPESPQD